jgi:hypothetical protein
MTEERATAHTHLRGLGALLRLLMSFDRGRTLLIYTRAQLGQSSVTARARDYAPSKVFVEQNSSK